MQAPRTLPCRVGAADLQGALIWLSRAVLKLRQADDALGLTSVTRWVSSLLTRAVLQSVAVNEHCQHGDQGQTSVPDYLLRGVPRPDFTVSYRKSSLTVYDCRAGKDEAKR